MTTTTISSPKTHANPSDRGLEIVRSVYQADHQNKFLVLHADAESLLQQLQNSKQQRNVVDHHHNN